MEPLGNIEQPCMIVHEMSVVCFSILLILDKGGQAVDSLKSMNKAIEYIEENLTEAIDFKEVAKIALCSEYHFKRMFSFLAGISLSEYIRRRRLTLAGFDLSNSDKKEQ